MLKTLENDILRLTVDTHGAEIHSLVAKDTGIEYIWQADPNYWQRHAPILFPIVGKLKNGQYEYDGTVYRMPGHGFARDKEFEFSGQTENSLEYTLTYDEDILRMYPFKFKLTVTYTINFAEIKVLIQKKICIFPLVLTLHLIVQLALKALLMNMNLSLNRQKLIH